MTELSKIRALIAHLVLPLAIWSLISCQSPPTTTRAVSARIETTTAALPTRDLRQDEAAGGHILRKHVGQTEEQLRERLERERNITGASTYANRETAERAVGAAIAQSRGQIQNWLSRPGRHPNLVLDYDSEAPIGRTMHRGENQSRVCQHAVVVLKYNGPNEYFVLTSYPECR